MVVFVRFVGESDCWLCHWISGPGVVSRAVSRTVPRVRQFFPVDVDQEGLSCCAWMLKAVSFSIFPVLIFGKASTLLSGLFNMKSLLLQCCAMRYFLPHNSVPCGTRFQSSCHGFPVKFLVSNSSFLLVGQFATFIHHLWALLPEGVNLHGSFIKWWLWKFPDCQDLQHRGEVYHFRDVRACVRGGVMFQRRRGFRSYSALVTIVALLCSRM